MDVYTQKQISFTKEEEEHIMQTELILDNALDALSERNYDEVNFDDETEFFQRLRNIRKLCDYILGEFE